MFVLGSSDGKGTLSSFIAGSERAAPQTGEAAIALV